MNFSFRKIRRMAVMMAMMMMSMMRSMFINDLSSASARVFSSTRAACPFASAIYVFNVARSVSPNTLYIAEIRFACLIFFFVFLLLLPIQLPLFRNSLVSVVRLLKDFPYFQERLALN